MILPDEDELDEVSQLIGGVDFVALGPEARIQIVTLAMKGKELAALDLLDDRLTHVSDWFRVSRIYEP